MNRKKKNCVDGGKSIAFLLILQRPIEVVEWSARGVTITEQGARGDFPQNTFLTEMKLKYSTNMAMNSTRGKLNICLLINTHKYTTLNITYGIINFSLC